MTLFRLVSYLEGLSFLILLGIAMPLKYAYGKPEAVKIVGMGHGVLFIAYVIVLTWLASEKEWSSKKSLMAFIAAVIPFGPFLFDKYCLSTDHSTEAIS